MKRRGGNILLGLLLIAVGMGCGGDVIGLWSFDPFFDGWWSLFLILPAAASILNRGPGMGNLILLGVGLVLLLSAQGYFDLYLVSRLFWPAILIIVGISVLAGGLRRGPRRYTQPTGSLPGKRAAYHAFFSGSDIRWPAEPFEGVSLTAVCGGIDLDLRSAVILQDVVVDVTAVFGGVDLQVPEGVRVKVAGTPVFGGVENKAAPAPETAPTVYVNALCIFGGMDVL